MDPPHFLHRKVGNKLSSDLKKDRNTSYPDHCNELGNELDPQSLVWNNYMEEAEEQDTELTTVRNKSLDTLLLFATLYSAVLTAFLIQSSGLLQQDNSEVTVYLLLNIAQSQQRMEIGEPDSNPPPVERPKSHAARSINILWFASLMVSLGVVMAVMLAKEWLGALTSYKTRHPHTYALQRQTRFDSLKSWRALPIIDFLPNLLYFSLVLFIIGLIVRLWLLDRIVAYVITALTAPGAVVYVIFVIAGAVANNCPYRTRLSSYLKAIISCFQRKDSNLGNSATIQPDGDNYIGQDDLSSLQWFLDHGRDPVTIGSACQALAGLKCLRLNPIHFNIHNLGSGSDEALSRQTIKPYCVILTLGAQVLERLSAASTKYYNELVACRGANGARYAIALSEIYPHALTWVQQSHRGSNDKRQDKLIESMNIMAHEILGSVFHVLDSVWADKPPPLPFTTDSYVYLTIAELKLIGHALSYLRPGAALPGETGRMNKDHIAITVFEATRVAKYEPGPSVLADLQKRYNRALSRAALLIQDSFKISKNIPPTSSARMIHDTLQAILGLITEDDLHSGGGISQDLYTYDVEIVIHVAQDAEYNMPRTISNWPAMRTGLLASVITLWGLGAEGLQYSKEVETVALSLVSKIGPDSMKHWSTRYGQTAWPNFTHNPSPNRPTRPDVPENPLTESIILQLLDIVNFSMLFLDRPDMYQLAEVALESLTCKAGTQDGQIILYKILIDQPECLIDWINALRSYSPATGHPGVEDTNTNRER